MPDKPLPRQAILIVNTASRAGAECFDRAVAALEQAGLELVDKIAVDDPKTLDSIIGDCVGKAPMVIVGGGDGTISTAVDHFVGRDTVLAVLPLGTANSFARTLGMPMDLEAAVEAIAAGRPRRIDVGAIDGDYFANTAIIGLSPAIAASIPPRLKRYLGRAAYLVWACRMAARFSPFRLTIEADGSKRHYWATEVRIANGRFFGGVEVVPGAKLDDGRIVVEAVTGKSKLHLAGSWLAALFRLRRDGGGKLESFCGGRFRIETRPRLSVAIDGERAARTPVDVTVEHEAVTVAVPGPRG